MTDTRPSLPGEVWTAHHVEVYRDDEDKTWGAHCLTCGFDHGGYGSETVASQVAGEHHESTRTLTKGSPHA